VPGYGGRYAAISRISLSSWSTPTLFGFHRATFLPDPENSIVNVHEILPRQKAASYIVAGCVIGFVIATLAPLLTNRAAEAALSNASPGEQHDSANVRNVVLSYTYETSPNSTAGDDSLAVDSIRFEPNYVLVTASSGKTSLFAVERLRQFSYRPASSK